jgi:hypothetical protein
MSFMKFLDPVGNAISDKVQGLFHKDKGNEPTPPDYQDLAQKQADLDRIAADRVAAANRPNQITPDGSSTWTMDPATGQWTQTTALSPGQQTLYDAAQIQKQQLAAAANPALAKAISATQGNLDFNGLPKVQSLDPSQLHAAGADLNPNADQMSTFDPTGEHAYGNLDYSSLGKMPDSGFGAVEDVRKAMLARTQPDLDMQRQREVQRLKAQGFNETDEGFGVSQDRLNRKDVDAQNQALLGATTAYNDIFNRGMTARRQGASELSDVANFANQTRAQQTGEQLAGDAFNNNILASDFAQKAQASAYANALRGQELGEQGTMRSASLDDRQRALSEQLLARSQPMAEYQQLSGMTQATSPTFSGYSNVGGASAAQIAKAAQDAYAAKASQYNADEAKSAGMWSGLLSTAGTLVGGYFGGPGGAALGGAAGRALAPTAGQAQTPYMNNGSYTWQVDANGQLVSVPS